MGQLNTTSTNGAHRNCPETPYDRKWIITDKQCDMHHAIDGTVHQWSQHFTKVCLDLEIFGEMHDHDHDWQLIMNTYADNQTVRTQHDLENVKTHLLECHEVPEEVLILIQQRNEALLLKFHEVMCSRMSFYEDVLFYARHPEYYDI